MTDFSPKLKIILTNVKQILYKFLPEIKSTGYNSELSDLRAQALLSIPSRMN